MNTMTKSPEPPLPSKLQKFPLGFEYDLTLRDIKKRIKTRTIA